MGQIITETITIPKSPPPCNCKKRVLAMACHAIKQRSGDLPALCQEFQQTESKQSEIPNI